MDRKARTNSVQTVVSSLAHRLRCGSILPVPNPLGFLPSSRYTIAIDKLADVGEYAGLVVLLHRALRGQGGGGEEERCPDLRPEPCPE